MRPRRAEVGGIGLLVALAAGRFESLAGVNTNPRRGRFTPQGREFDPLDDSASLMRATHFESMLEIANDPG